MPFSQTSLLAVRRIRGLDETYRIGGLAAYSYMPGVEAEYFRIEPSFQIILDEEPIGTMEPLNTIREVKVAGRFPPPPIEESSQFEIQAGYHTLRVETVKRPFYQTVVSENQSFDIAPGETVRFFCQYAPAGLNKAVWRIFIGPYKHGIVLQRE
jgi:hypothetical protein